MLSFVFAAFCRSFDAVSLWIFFCVTGKGGGGQPLQRPGPRLPVPEDAKARQRRASVRHVSVLRESCGCVISVVRAVVYINEKKTRCQWSGEVEGWTIRDSEGWAVRG